MTQLKLGVTPNWRYCVFSESEHKSVEMLCAICDDETDEVHFGAQCCAACAAFFRRSVALDKVYSCARDGNCPLDKTVRCVCRACRFDKCIAVGMDMKQVQPQRDGGLQKTRVKRENTHQLKTECLINNEELPSCSKLTVKPVLIEKMVRAYRDLEHHRRLAYCSTSLKSLFIDGEPQLEEYKLKNMDEGMKFHQMEISFLAEYLKSMEAFQQLPSDQKGEMFKCYLTVFCTIEGCYRTVKMGGVEKNRMICVDNTYLEIDNFAEIYDASTSVNIDGETAVKLFKPTWDVMINQILKPLHLCQMDDAEFVAISAIASWICDSNIANCTIDTKNVGTMVRNQLFDELFAYYSEHEVADPELRLGNLLMITPAILQYARMSIENFRMIKFFDLVSYSSLLDELFT